MLGRILGDRYRVLSRLGEGGMGTVYLCEHAVLHRRFAVKVLRPELGSDAELVDRFRNEAIAASRIGQENVVDVLDFGAEEDGALYYVMEALEGRSLGAVIREEGPLPIGRGLDILDQICRALGAAHARGVVHRDVKPDNVFLVRRDGAGDRVKVLDFGISHVPAARGAERITRAGALIGTPEYMAPEQATGSAVDARSDVYAAGVLAYEMLTGTLPIEEDTPIATLVAHQTRTPDAPSQRVPAIPPAVDALLLRALAKRPEDRFASMDAFAAEVACVRVALARSSAQRRTDPGAAPHPRVGVDTLSLDGPPPGLSRARRRPAPALAAAAIAAGAVLVAAAWWTLAGPRPDAGAPTPPGASAPAPIAPEGPAAVDPPVLVEEGGPASEPARVEPPRNARRRPPTAAEGGGASDELKDPYSGGGPLKDPFE
jgi:serine/threonine-protein kinase